MGLLKFCKNFIRLRNQPISFAGREYLKSVYGAIDRHLILRCSRQVEKSTLLCNRIIYEAIANPGTSMIFVCPRQEQAAVFSKSRLIPAIEGSPVVSRLLLGNRGRRPQVKHMRFRNGSEVYIRAAFHSADPVRGLSADLLFIDEFQDIADQTLPVLQETLSHSTRPRVILTATPKGEDNHVESIFQQSTGNEWHIPCHTCKLSFIPDDKLIGPAGLVCPNCRGPIQARDGRWVARNPASRWGEGFWINHLMVPWLKFDDILLRQATYDAARFKNECLGLPTQLGDHLITREEIEACCTKQAMATKLADVPREYRDRLLAGIDWSGGVHSATVVTIGYIREDKNFVVVRFEQLRAQEDSEVVSDAVAKLCREFRVRFIAADGGGNGGVYNRVLFSKVESRIPIYAILYSSTEQEPKQDGVLYKWIVDRSGTIGGLFTRIKKRMTLFPKVGDCGKFLQQFTCETAEFDPYLRTVRYVCPEHQHDDALHSLNYVQVLALRMWHSHFQYGG
ncbi:MAG: phage terminase large subunit family protein [Planctomycetia bacterium]|nr:phage terminase large subunit family protein [Planctomycetia bacterium]